MPTNKPMPVIDYITLNKVENEALVSELRYLLSDTYDFSPEWLLTLYEMLYVDLRESGGCDHSVGICACQQKDTLQMLAEKLGHSANPEAWDFDFPQPETLQKRFNHLKERLKNGSTQGS